MKSATEQQLSPRNHAALQYLRRLKPQDGYAIESYIATSGEKQVRLKRKNVPVRDEGFKEIVVDRSAGHVVGIQVVTSGGHTGRGIILVDGNGKPRNGDSTVTVQMANVSASASGSASRGSGSRRSQSEPASEQLLPGVDNELLLRYGLMALGAMVAFKIVLAALNVLTVLALPLAYLYACSRVPPNESFDAKKELKRVMRGAHLPEERQPQGFFEQGLNRLAASVTAELATSLGYEVAMTDYFGAAKLASVKVPVASAEYYWIGVVGKWRYIGQREIPGNKSD